VLKCANVAKTTLRTLHHGQNHLATVIRSDQLWEISHCSSPDLVARLKRMSRGTKREVSKEMEEEWQGRSVHQGGRRGSRPLTTVSQTIPTFSNDQIN